jgi:hypothetical protein
MVPASSRHTCRLWLPIEDGQPEDFVSAGRLNAYIVAKNMVHYDQR